MTKICLSCPAPIERQCYQISGTKDPDELNQRNDHHRSVCISYRQLSEGWLYENENAPSFDPFWERQRSLLRSVTWLIDFAGFSLFRSAFHFIYRKFINVFSLFTSWINRFKLKHFFSFTVHACRNKFSCCGLNPLLNRKYFHSFSYVFWSECCSLKMQNTDSYHILCSESAFISNHLSITPKMILSDVSLLFRTRTRRTRNQHHLDRCKTRRQMFWIFILNGRSSMRTRSGGVNIRTRSRAASEQGGSKPFSESFS